MQEWQGEKKRFVPQKRVIWEVSLFPGAACLRISGPIPASITPWPAVSVWTGKSFCSQLAVESLTALQGTHVDPHLQRTPWRPKLARAPGS